MRHPTIPWMISIVLVGAGATAGLLRWHDYRERIIVVEKRIEDVRTLTTLYHEQGLTTTNIHVLVEALRDKGVTLHNPIPRDSSRPCYRVGSYATNPSVRDVIIEETDNVDDDTSIVRSYGDLSVQLERRR